MKNRICILIILSILVVSPLLSGLYVNRRNITKNRNIVHMEMVWEKAKGKVTDLNIRFGPAPNRVDGEGILTGRSGRKMKFRDIVEAVNHIKKNGWLEVRSFIQCFSGKSEYHFIFKKKE